MRYTVVINVVMVGALGNVGAPAQDKWYSNGHAHITTGAIQHLSGPLRVFFDQNAATIATLSGQEPAGTHYIDIDYYPEFFAGTLPHSYSALVALYGKQTVDDNGTVPWTIGTYTGTLANAMYAAHTVRAWLNLRTTAGALAHYIEDAHNPLHLTQNYNGQMTGNTGIHSRYEGQMINRHLADLPIAPAPELCVHYSNMVEAVFDEIDVNYWYVDDIMDADTIARGSPPSYGEAYYTALWAYTGSFTQAVFQDASVMVASAWYTAWVNAGQPTPLLAIPGDLNCDSALTYADINPFVLALAGQSGYETQYPTCNWLNADTSGDGAVSYADINPFVQLLNGK